MPYTLKEAAREIGIDTKTLRRYLDRANIIPERDEADLRSFVLSQEQVDSVPRPAKRETLDRQVRDLQELVTTLQATVVQLTRDVRQLQSQYFRVLQAGVGVIQAGPMPPPVMADEPEPLEG